MWVWGEYWEVWGHKGYGHVWGHVCGVGGYVRRGMWGGGPVWVGGYVGMCMELGMCGWMWGGYVGEDMSESYGQVVSGIELMHAGKVLYKYLRKTKL